MEGITFKTECYIGIYTLFFDIQNKLKWIRKNPLKQLGFDYGFMGLYGFVKENNLHLLFSESEDNLNLNKIEDLKTYDHTGDKCDKGFIVDAIITRDKITLNKVARLKDYDFPITVGDLKKVGTNLIDESAKRSLLFDKVLQDVDLVFYCIDVK